MSDYYGYWEKELYSAVVEMTINNLDLYFALLKRQTNDFPCAIVEILLRGSEIVLDPDAPTVVEGCLTIVKNIIEGSKKFIRHLRYVY